MAMAWWQIGVLGVLILALALGASLLRGRGRTVPFALLAALAGGVTWITVGLMLGGIAPGRTALMLPASTGLVPPQNEALRLEREIYAMLAERHPEAAATIANIEKLRDAGSQAKLAETRLALLGSYLPLYAPRASDAAIRAFATVAIDNLDMLRARDPELCRQTATGRHAAMADAMMVPAAAALSDVLNSAMSQPQPPPDAAEAIGLRRAVVDALYASGDPSLVERRLLGRSADAPPDAYCRTFIRIFRNILALPPDRSSKVLRLYYGQEGERG